MRLVGAWKFITFGSGKDNGALVAFAFGFLATDLVDLAIVLVVILFSPLVCVLFLSCDIHMKPCGWERIKRLWRDSMESPCIAATCGTIAPDVSFYCVTTGDYRVLKFWLVSKGTAARLYLRQIHRTRHFMTCSIALGERYPFVGIALSKRDNIREP